MLKPMATFAAVTVLGLAVLGLGVSTKPSMAGSWQVDTRHSAVQLITDATTNYGKNKLDYTVGFARVMGEMKIDDADPAKSSVAFRFYPANSMVPPIAENGKFLSQWLADEANHTLVCFHSKTVERTADGRIRAAGVLTLTRVDRNVQAEPTEAYSGRCTVRQSSTACRAMPPSFSTSRPMRTRRKARSLRRPLSTCHAKISRSW